MSSQLPTVQCQDGCNTPPSDLLTTIQFIGQGRLLAVLKNANLNTTNDQAITIPTGNWVLSEVIVANSSGTSTTAVGGIYDAPSKGGNQVVANTQIYTGLTGGASVEVLTPSAYAGNHKFTSSTIYLSLTTAEGAALTADVYLYYWDLDPTEEIVTQATDCTCKRNFLIQHSGVNGTNGTDGTDGANAFTATNANFVMPIVTGTVSVTVLDTSWMVATQVVYVEFGGYFTVDSVTDATHVVLNNLGYTGNAAPATVIVSTSKVSPGGLDGPQGPTGPTGPQGPAGTPGVATVHGQCRLGFDSGNLLLLPFNGNTLVIDSNAETIPDAGVSLAPGGLGVDTNYYIYAYMNTGTMTLEASATGHSTEAGTGIEIQTGDSTRSLVGFARTVAGPAWSTDGSQIFLLSWFNPRPVSGSNVLTTDFTTASLTYVAVGTPKVEFLCWANRGVQLEANGTTSNNTAGYSCYTSLGIDGLTPEDSWTNQRSSSNNFQSAFAPSVYRTNLSEGYHYMTILGAVEGNTGAWGGSASVGFRSSLRVMVQG